MYQCLVSICPFPHFLDSFLLYFSLNFHGSTFIQGPKFNPSFMKHLEDYTSHNKAQISHFRYRCDSFQSYNKNSKHPNISLMFKTNPTAIPYIELNHQSKILIKKENSDVSKNGEVRNSESLPMHKISRKTGKTYQNQHFRTLKTNEKLAAIKKILNEENQLDLGKNSKLCGILTYPSFTHCSSALLQS